MSDLHKQLDEEKQDESWSPAPGETLVGEVLELRRVETKFGESGLAEIAREPDGEVVLVWLKTVLARKFKRLRIAEGDRVAIKYLGKQEGESFSYHDYGVAVDNDVRAMMKERAKKELGEMV